MGATCHVKCEMKSFDSSHGFQMYQWTLQAGTCLTKSAQLPLMFSEDVVYNSALALLEGTGQWQEALDLLGAAQRFWYPGQTVTPIWEDGVLAMNSVFAMRPFTGLESRRKKSKQTGLVFRKTKPKVVSACACLPALRGHVCGGMGAEHPQLRHCGRRL